MKEYFQPVGHQPLIQPLQYAYLSVFLVECYFNSYYHIINFFFNNCHKLSFLCFQCGIFILFFNLFS